MLTYCWCFPWYWCKIFSCSNNPGLKNLNFREIWFQWTFPVFEDSSFFSGFQSSMKSFKDESWNLTGFLLTDCPLHIDCRISIKRKRLLVSKVISVWISQFEILIYPKPSEPWWVKGRWNIFISSLYVRHQSKSLSALTSLNVELTLFLLHYMSPKMTKIQISPNFWIQKNHSFGYDRYSQNYYGNKLLITIIWMKWPNI